MSDQGKFLSVLDEAALLREKKNADYGASWRQHGEYGLVVRLTDKMNRLNSLVKLNNRPQVEEPIRDTAIDIINYAAMLVMLIDEKDKG